MDHSAAAGALASGHAFVDLSSWRKVEISGADAFEWLNDLASADISGLSPGQARRSLLLSPTGRIRAEFTVSAQTDGLLLIQDPRQPKPIGALLAPYVLSSDVLLRDRTAELALFVFPGLALTPELDGAWSSAPSCVGTGVDLLASAHDHDALLLRLSNAYILSGPDALEEWRVASGNPRFGVDVLEEDLPQEGGLDDAVSFDKGCYLGQEAVAKVRNLGHPRRTVLHLLAEEPVSTGDAVLAGDERAGEVTSVAADGARRWLLARVRWELRSQALRTSTGVSLLPAGDRQVR